MKKDIEATKRSIVWVLNKAREKNISLGCASLSDCIGKDPRLQNPVTEDDYEYVSKKLGATKKALFKVYAASTSPTPKKHAPNSKQIAMLHCRVSLAILSLLLLLVIVLLRLRN